MLPRIRAANTRVTGSVVRLPFRQLPVAVRSRSMRSSMKPTMRSSGGRLAGVACGFSMKARAIIGDSVSATMAETVTAPTSVKANSVNSAPVRPPWKPIGT